MPNHKDTQSIPQHLRNPGACQFQAFQQRFSAYFLKAVDRYYRPFLKLILHWRYVSLSIGIAILIITVGYIKSGRLGFELFPKVESDYAKVTATLPYLGPHAGPIRDGLKSLQKAFREASAHPDEPGKGPGEKFTGPVY